MSTVRTHIERTIKIGVLAAALRAFRYISHFYKFKICGKDSKIYFYLCDVQYITNIQSWCELKQKVSLATYECWSRKGHEYFAPALYVGQL
mgnify:CR=1 FL=1